MGATISIDTMSPQRLPHPGGSRPIPKEEVHAVSRGCALLLETIGNSRDSVEVVKVTPWHAYEQPNIYEVKVILSLRGENSSKVEALGTFEHHTYRSRIPIEWDLEKLTERIVNEMTARIKQAVEQKLFNLIQAHSRWEKIGCCT